MRTGRAWVIDAALRLSPANRRRLAAGAIAAVTLTYLALYDPHRATRMRPRCPVKLITGLDCPACGGMRMAYDVAHGDARAALQDNAFLLTCSPLLAGLLMRGVVAGDEQPVPPALAYSLGAAALAWMALRNLPGWPLQPTLRG